MKCLNSSAVLRLNFCAKNPPLRQAAKLWLKKLKHPQKLKNIINLSGVNLTQDRKEIFDQIKKLMKKYEPPFVARNDFDSRYELWSEKEIEIDGRKRKEIYFGGLIIQSSYVGFYFMPVYTDTSLKEIFEPELLSTLKGKSCFHIKKLDKKLLSQIKKSLEAGFKLYKKRGWV